MIVYGRQVAREAMRAGINPKRIWCKRTLTDHVRNMFPKAEIRTVHPKIIASICGSDEHQGLAIEIELKENKLDEFRTKEDSIIVLLDGVQDVGNIGNVIRTSEFFGCSAVILTKENTPNITPAMIKSSAGAFFHIPVVREKTKTILDFLKSRMYKIYAFEAWGEKDIMEVKFEKPAVFCFGGEDKGLSKDIIGSAESIIRIPGFGKTQSLNVSATVAISLGIFIRENYKSR